MFRNDGLLILRFLCLGFLTHSGCFPRIPSGTEDGLVHALLGLKPCNAYEIGMFKSLLCMLIQAYAEENPAFTTPSFDGGWRVWKKSDPATTGTKTLFFLRIIVLAVINRLTYFVSVCIFVSGNCGNQIQFLISLLYIYLFFFSYNRCLRPPECGLHY